MWIFIRLNPSHVKLLLLLLLLLLLFSYCLQTQTKQAKYLFTYYIRTHHDAKLGIMYILIVIVGFLKNWIYYKLNLLQWPTGGRTVF